MMEIRPTLVFDSRIVPEANRITSGEIWVLVPANYEFYNGYKIYLFFPNLLPCPELYLATVCGLALGTTANLLNRAKSEGIEIKTMPKSRNQCQLSLLFSLKAEKIPMSQTDVVNKAYAAGELPEVPE